MPQFRTPNATCRRLDTKDSVFVTWKGTMHCSVQFHKHWSSGWSDTRRRNPMSEPHRRAIRGVGLSQSANILRFIFSQCEKRQLQSRLALFTHMQTFHDSGTYSESCVWFRPPWEWNAFIMFLFIGICHCGDRNARNTQLPMSTKKHTGNRMIIHGQNTNLQAWKASNPEETLSNVL